MFLPTMYVLDSTERGFVFGGTCNCHCSCSDRGGGTWDGVRSTPKGCHDLCYPCPQSKDGSYAADSWCTSSCNSVSRLGFIVWQFAGVVAGVAALCLV